MAGEHFKTKEPAWSQLAQGFWSQLAGAMAVGAVLCALFLVLAWAMHVEYSKDLADLLDLPTWTVWALVSVSLWLFLLVWLPRLAVLLRSVRVEGDRLSVHYGPLARRMNLCDVSRIDQAGSLIVIHGVQGNWLLRRGGVAGGFERLHKAWRQALAGSGIRPLSPPAKRLPVDSPILSLLATAIAVAGAAVLALSMELRQVFLYVMAGGGPLLFAWAIWLGRAKPVYLTCEALVASGDARQRFLLEQIEWSAWEPVKGGAQVHLLGPGSRKVVRCQETDAALLCNSVLRRSPDAVQLALEGGWLYIPSGAQASNVSHRLRRLLRNYNLKKLDAAWATLAFGVLVLLSHAWLIFGVGLYEGRRDLLNFLYMCFYVVDLAIALFLLWSQSRETQSQVARAMEESSPRDQAGLKRIYRREEEPPGAMAPY